MKYSGLSALFLLISLFITTSLSSQTLDSIGSLLNVFNSVNDTKHRALGTQLWQQTTDETVFFDDKPQLTPAMSDDEFDMTVLFCVERWMTSCSYFSEAIPVIEKVLPLSEQIKNNDIRATALCDKAYCLYKLSKYAESIEVSQQALYFSERHENWLQYSRAYVYMSLVNYGLRNYDEAVVLIESAIEANDKLGNNVQTHNTYGVACELYCGAGQLDKAVEYGLKAVEAARQMGYPSGVANHLTQLSYAYDRRGDYQLGLDAANEAIEIVRGIEPLDRNQLAISLEFKGWNLIDMKRNAEAVEALREAIYWEKEVGNAQAVCYDYRTLYEALEPIDAREALAALKRYTVMVDSLHFLQLKELTTKANAELHNDELQQENAHSREMMRYIIFTSIAVAILLLIIILSLIYAFRQKRRTAEALRSLSEARETFFTNVTHEFRTPLTVILGLGHELQDGRIAADRQSEAGEMIVRQGDRLLTLVNQMLDISKVKSNIGEQSIQRADLSAFVNMIIETYREVARQKGVVVKYNTDSKGVITDFVPDYIEKMAGNLINNAVKFTAQGGSVIVELKRYDSTIELRVTDTGCGISAEDLPHIFEPFYTAQYKEGTGSGVGLALVKQIAEAMQATIDVQSTENHGTAFTVQWQDNGIGNVELRIRNVGINSINPINPINSLNPINPINSINSINSLNPQSSTLNVSQLPSILVVEDNEDVLRYMSILLEDRYDMYYASDGSQGLALAREILPDLIITDLMMPKMDGLDLCRAIRSDVSTDHIPIIVVTAKATEEDKIRGLQAGADSYLVKPFNTEELFACISNLLDRREKMQRKYLQEGDFGLSETGAEVENIPISSLQQSKKFMDQIGQVVSRLLPDNCSAERVAQEMYMSLRTLQRKMLVIAGTTPKKYIMDARLALAKRIIEEDPDRTLEDVAAACGFHDASHLAKNYQKTFGITPRKR